MLQKRYEGFLKTTFLWAKDVVYNFQQFKVFSECYKIDINIDENLRLGKYVERLVSFELGQHNNISILAENIQIQDSKITLGELDCLLLKNNKPIHLEIIYKFYLYDASVGSTEIEHFIGPNRKDSLIEKLTKLKTKQLPLLYAKACKPYLDALGLIPENITQQIYFKAQLFLPFSNQNVLLKTLNNACIVGFYINPRQLYKLKDCKLYMPNKKDWLIHPHSNVNWLSFNAFNKATKEFRKNQFSALCWVKFNSGELKKMFLIWW